MFMSSPDLVIAGGTIRDVDFLGAVVVDSRSSNAEASSTLFAVYDNGAWQNAGTFPWSVVSVSVFKEPQEQFALLASDGRVHLAGSGDQHNETIVRITEEPLRGLGTVNGVGYAVGMGYQVYRRAEPNNWSPLVTGLPCSTGQLIGFEALDGFSENEIYAVGWQGALWTFDGNRWSFISSPTNFILGSVTCASDGVTYACGRQGSVLRGRHHRWETLTDDDFIDDLWDVVEFQKQIYFAGSKNLYQLVDDELEPIEISTPNYSGTQYQLSTAGGFLCSVGEHDILIFDGKDWTRVSMI